MPFIGNQPALSYTSFAVQHFTTSATTSYTLDYSVANENEIRLVINNVVQQPGSSYAYTASGTTLTLSAATSATDTMYAVFLGKAVQTVTPASGSVTLDMLSATGTKDSTTFLRGDNTFASVTTTGRIIQMVQGTDGSALSSSSTSYVDTGLSASITPNSTSNKILVLVSMGVFGADAAGTGGAAIKLMRDSTDLIVHSSMGAHPTITFIYTAGTSFSYLDSPSSTSSLTYKTQFKSNGGENFLTDNGSTATITLLEVSQ